MAKSKKKSSKKKKSKSTSTAIATAAPTGLAISRSGGVVTFSWSIGAPDYNGGQNFFWDLGGVRQWGAYPIGGATSMAFGIPLGGSFTSIAFGVQGAQGAYSVTTGKKKKKKTVTYCPVMSGWAVASVAVTPPPEPKVSFKLDSSNEGTFSWSIDNVSDSAFNIFHRYEWESILVDKHNSSTPPTNWDGATKGSGTTTSGEWKCREDSSLFVGEDYSFTRWFRIRSAGPGGATAWKYAYHVYALPRQAINVTAELTRKSAGNGYMCIARWVAPESFMYPVETATVQYSMAKPTTTTKVVDGTRVVEWSCPDASWTNAGTVSDTSGQDAFTFSIDKTLGADEMVFVRIVTKHDDHEMPSDEVFASGVTGFLNKATDIVIQPNLETHRVNIAAKNPSDISASFIAIYFRMASTPDIYKIVGILPKNLSNITVQCPDWGEDEFSFGLQVMLANYSPATRLSEGVTDYILSDIKMKADEIQWDEGRVPMPPKSVVATAVNSSTIRVLWEWAWDQANKTELSWANHDDAWESTDEPRSYTVNDLFAGRWNISGVDVGTWYVRARHIQESEDLTLYGLWSDTKVVKLSSAPAIPALILSDGVALPDGEVTCYWAYVSTDGTSQMQANICEAILDPNTGIFSYEPAFARAETAQHLTFSIADRGWQAGEKHYLAIRVISASGEQSEAWSTPIALQIANGITCQITSTSLEDKSEPTDVYYLTSDETVDPDKTYYTRSGSSEDDYVYTVVASPIDSEISSYYERGVRNFKALTELPLEVNIAGAGIGSTTIIAIERSEAFHMRRPDESEIDGYKGETVYLKTFENDGHFVIEKKDLIGYLDDRAQYKLTATAKDSLGQVAEDAIDFTVDWEHQAIVPSGKVVIDEEHDIAILTPLLVDGYALTSDTAIKEDKSYYTREVDEETGDISYDVVLEPVIDELSTYYEIVEGTAPEGDVCDIYRLSVDKPELVYENAEFGKEYVDPYPTIGDYGGYRFVYKTYNGDYTTSDGHIAWYNTTEGENEIIDTFTSIINYGGDRISLPYNLSLSSRWAKDFQQTSYLGGHIQGDWNPAVSRTGTITSVGIVNPDLGSDEDTEVIESIRRLAVWTGICHVRTPDGSSYAANVNVSEDREQKMINKLANYSLEITRVDTEGLDGMTYEQWQDLIKDEE